MEKDKKDSFVWSYKFIVPVSILGAFGIYVALGILIDHIPLSFFGVMHHV